MSRTELVAKFLKWMKSYGDHVSFVEIQRFLESQDIETKGDFCVELPGPEVENVILWYRMSERFVEFMQDLLGSRAVKVVPASPLVYLADGGLPGMPTVKRACKYKKPHWLPVCFRLTGAAS